ncbi:venom serine carboxypeptidase-like [Bombyx mandarina]|uniref:Carboxypeptidase n=1 Tax=Bombyx mandarina TaxID=7092 RepID=A0A6J2K1M2_BOMMA|nr:venom serine carboxypeptidase-like [Bombyx mandarina]
MSLSLAPRMSTFFGLLFIVGTASTTQTQQPVLLTTLINSNRIEEARRLSSVNRSIALEYESYSGFLTVNKQYNSNTFFWYFPVRNKPKDSTPWIIWLQGGPGASSLAGLFDEIGPFSYNKKNDTIEEREWTWLKGYSMLFIDNPVGAGFSFTDSNDGFVKNMDECASDLYTALKQFLIIFPELRTAPLYIAGESYAGRYIPPFAMKLAEQDLNIGTFEVNLQGIIMGNPVVDRYSVANYTSTFQQWGLIDTQGAMSVKSLQDQYIKAILDGDASAAYDLRDQLLYKLTKITLQNQFFNVLKSNKDLTLSEFAAYLQKSTVKEALHVGDTDFSFINTTVDLELKSDFLTDIGGTVTKLLEHCKVLIYCGQLDLTAPCVQSAQYRRRYWQWNKKELFLRAPRRPWLHKNVVAGYTKSGGGFTEVLVKGAGHLVPIDKPEELYELISWFVSSRELLPSSDFDSASEYVPDLDKSYFSSTSPSAESALGPQLVGLIISIIINFILVISIVVASVYFLRRRREIAAYFYNNVDETSISQSFNMT